MYRKILLTALLGFGFCACKPTERKVPTAQPKEEQKGEAEPVQEPQPQEGKTQEVVQQPAVEEPATAPEEFSSDCLMQVRCTTQAYNQLIPWKKGNTARNVQSGVYLGDGQVLVCSSALRAATHVSISLPDGSRLVPARIVKYDDDLGLGLLTVAKEEDRSIFDTRKAYPVGDALKVGDMAKLQYLVNGAIPSSMDLLAEGGASASMARICLKAQHALTGNIYAAGAPVMRDGRLVALTAGYNETTQTFTCVNAELIKRFLTEDSALATAGAPVLGLQFEPLRDPVFRRYLKLDDAQTGLYVSKVACLGAAESAGVKEGDVITAVEGVPVDSQGRCQHPLYGPMDVGCLVRSIKPLGATLRVTVSRNGESKEVEIPLNRDAMEKALIGTERPGVQPRYILWGGLVFQPVTYSYLQAIQGENNGLPVPFLEIPKREKELRAKGVTEAVALSRVIPTKAVSGYDECGGCLVETVNGRAIHNFQDLAEALDAPTKDGIMEITFNSAPYAIYVDTKMAEDANADLRKRGIHKLRNLGGGK